MSCTRLTATSDKVYQLLAHGLWFSPCTPASSTTKTGRHDIAEILLKVALNTKNQKSNHDPKQDCCQILVYSQRKLEASRARTHTILGIGLYELLGNPSS
jgi:hypothetical protein